MSPLLSKGEGEKFPALSKKEVRFLLSLYPRGRSQKSLLEQLKKKYPDTDEGVLANKMKRWVLSLKSDGLLSLVQTEDAGTVVSLSKLGAKIARSRIRKMYSDDLDAFVKIMNRLVESDDEWGVAFLKAKSSALVSSNLPFYALVFRPEKLEGVARSLLEDFGIDIFQKERGDRFRRVVKKMDSLGLLEVTETPNGPVLEATPFAKDLFSQALTGERGSRPVQPSRSGSGGNPSILSPPLLLSALLSVLLTLVISFALFPAGSAWLCLAPLLIFPLYPAAKRLAESVSWIPKEF
jgi:hypothetical protein